MASKTPEYVQEIANIDIPDSYEPFDKEDNDENETLPKSSKIPNFLLDAAAGDSDIKTEVPEPVVEVKANNNTVKDVFGKISKIELPKFTENVTNAETWIRRCLYSFDLYKITDIPSIVAKMLSTLPDRLQQSVQHSLAAS